MNQTDPDLDALLGAVVGGKYRVDALLGRGGMGAVYRATNTGIGKRVALKFLYREAARDLDAVARFQREAEAASAVESAHIVEIFDSGTTDDGLPFLVMELLKGEDLRTRLRRESRLSVGEAVRITAQVARGLRRAHEADIVHRDLKPDNIFLCQRDDDPTFVKIVDFGISKVSRKQATTSTLTRRGTVLGTAFYMAPEQAQAKRDVDGRADIFSLGAILFEALAGRPPHMGSAYEAVLIDICTKDAPDIREFAPEVSGDLAAVVARALQRERSLRFQTAREVYESLVACLPGAVPPSGEAEAARFDGDGTESPSKGEATPAAAPSGALAEVGTGTVSGTAVRSAGAQGRAPARRTAAALIAAVGLVGITMYLFARPSPPEQGTATPATRAPQALPSIPVPNQGGAKMRAPEPVGPTTTSSSPQIPRPSGSSLAEDQGQEGSAPGRKPVRPLGAALVDPRASVDPRRSRNGSRPANAQGSPPPKRGLELATTPE